MDRLVYWIYRFIGLAVRPFPVAAIFRAGEFLGVLGYYAAGSYRRLALRNLEIAFGAEMNAAERRRLARRHFRTLIGNLLASMKIAGLSADEIRQLFTVENWEIVDRLFEEKRPIVWIVSHIGNWELLAQIMPLLLPLRPGTIYQRLGNPFIDADVRAARAAQGMLLFERKEGFQGAIKTVREGGGVGILMDQHAGDAGIWCPFFGRLASTSPLAATLALRAKSTLLSLAVHTGGPGRWRVVIDPVVESAGGEAGELTTVINKAIELQIRSQPEDWFWLHNRWKTPKPKFLLATYKRGVSLNPQQALQPFRIVIRSSNWLGDAIMSIPAVRAIKRGRPDAHVTILCPAKLADVWKTVTDVDEVVSIEPHENVFAVARKIRGRFEASILFPNSLRTALEAWLAGIPRRVGYPGHRRSWLLDQVLREKRGKKAAAPRHQVHQHLRLAEFVGADIADALESTENADSSLARETNRTVARIAVCPGAEYGPAKRWPPERFAEVMTRLSAAQPCEWVLVGVANDAPIGDEIARQFTGPLRNLIGQTTLAQLMAELRECDLLLTNDTGTMHLAAFLGVPVAAIFGSTEPALTGPLGSRHRVVRHHVSCSPCFLRECPIDFRCMQQVSAETVHAAIDEILQRGNRQTAGAKRPAT